jgi:hypothetical protein
VAHRDGGGGRSPLPIGGGAEESQITGVVSSLCPLARDSAGSGSGRLVACPGGCSASERVAVTSSAPLRGRFAAVAARDGSLVVAQGRSGVPYGEERVVVSGDVLRLSTRCGMCRRRVIRRGGAGLLRAAAPTVGDVVWFT